MMFSFLHRMQHDEGGAGLVYAALVLLLLAVFTLTVLDVGQVVQRKVEAQTAADTAAYSAAANHAKIINVITFLNLVIIAAYGAIAVTWVLAAATCALAWVACVQAIDKAIRISRVFYNFAKKVNTVQKVIVDVAGPSIALESYRIAYRNLTDGKEPDENMSISGILDGFGDMVQHGALTVSGVPAVLPDMNDAVRKGRVDDLLAEVPDNRDEMPSAGGGVSKKMKTTRYDTIIVETTVYCPDYIVDSSVCHDCFRYYRNNQNQHYRQSRDCYYYDSDKDENVQRSVTDVVKYVNKKETVEVVEEELDTEGTGPPMPFFLNAGDWQKALRFTAFAFRFEKGNAVTEKMFNKDDMLPYNITIAEAETYDLDRKASDIKLIEPDWEARMRPVSIQSSIIDLLPEKWRNKVSGLFDYVIVH